MTLLVLVTIILLFGAAEANARQPASKRPAWMSRFAWAVGICETGKGTRHPDFQHHAGSYEGFAGWFHGTWLLDRPRGAPEHAYSASRRQQYSAFLTGRARGRYWGCIAHGGYLVWIGRA